MRIARALLFASLVPVGMVACSSASSGGSPTDGGSESASGSDASDGGGGCAIPCASQCCNADAVCVSDMAGNKTCAVSCTDSKACPPASPCCGPGGESKTGATDQWAGLPSTFYATAVCRCVTGAACGSGVCGPQTDSTGNPFGPYVCKPNDSKPYDGCGGCPHCGSAPGLNCWNDPTAGDAICAKSCNTNVDCGDAGNVCCKPATCGNCLNSCGGSGMCGPC